MVLNFIIIFMSDNQKWLDIPWVKEQVKKWLQLKDGIDVKQHLSSLQKEALITFFRSNKDQTFSKWKNAPENSAAYVAMYQRALNLVNGANIEIDGIYGDKTKAAIVAFQQSTKWGAAITDDGIPWPDTAGKLIAALTWTPAVAPAAAAPETPAQKIEKAKTKIIEMWNRLNTTIQFKAIESDWRFFTQDFSVGNRKFNIGVTTTWETFAFEVKNGDSWLGKTGDWNLNKAQELPLTYIQEVLQKVKDSEKPASTWDLMKFKDKITGTWTPNLIFTSDADRLYFTIETWWVGWYIRLEKADIFAGKAATYQNVKTWWKDYASITLTPKVMWDTLQITVSSLEKAVTQRFTLTNHPEAADILKSIQRIPWLSTATLQSLGFTIDTSQNLSPPVGLERTDTSRSAVKLSEWYEVQNGTIKKKSPQAPTNWA